MLPFVCCTLTLKEHVPIDVLQTNEWLAEVTALRRFPWCTGS